MFQFADGGETNLMWSNSEGYTEKTPIVVILPGLTGCESDGYITSFVRVLNRRNYR